MASTRDLHPAFRDEAEDLFAFAKDLDPGFRITSSRRSRAEQQRLYNRWIAGESDLPAAPPGASKHELGLAIDIARPSIDPRDDELLYQLGQAWQDAGGKWGGDDDPVHFEHAGPVPEDTLQADISARRAEMNEVLSWTPLGQAVEWVKSLF